MITLTKNDSDDVIGTASADKAIIESSIADITDKAK